MSCTFFLKTVSTAYNPDCLLMLMCVQLLSRTLSSGCKNDTVYSNVQYEAHVGSLQWKGPVGI